VANVALVRLGSLVAALLGMTDGATYTKRPLPGTRRAQAHARSGEGARTHGRRRTTTMDWTKNASPTDRQKVPERLQERAGETDRAAPPAEAQAGQDAEQAAAAGSQTQTRKDELIRRLSGGAGVDPLTKTVGGPDSPTGVSLTEGGATGVPLADQEPEEAQAWR
jgi:hypothetical protein